MKRWLKTALSGVLGLSILPLGAPLLAQQATSPPALESRASPPAFSGMGAGQAVAGWRLAGLPGQKMPMTRFDLVTLEGRQVLRVTAEASYGTLVHDTPRLQLGSDALLRWSWRLDRGLSGSDLSRREGDDSPLKICALFDMPLDGLGFAERSKMRLARALSGLALPSATLCYVWDRLLPVGSAIANAHSERVRFVVASSGEARPGQWLSLERRIAADFMLAFGHETATLPPLIALLVGADADNSGGRSLAYVGDLVLLP